MVASLSLLRRHPATRRWTSAAVQTGVSPSALPSLAARSLRKSLTDVWM
jgi:hypothetical protein